MSSLKLRVATTPDKRSTPMQFTPFPAVREKGPGDEWAVSLNLLQNRGLRPVVAQMLPFFRGEPRATEDRMQNPQERPQAQLSVVGACSVTDCRFNEDHECHAGSIEVRVGPDGAHCATYQPEGSTRPRP